MKPFDLGKDARKQWASIECNPFNVVCETDEHLEWLSGWKDEDKKINDRATNVLFLVVGAGLLVGALYVYFF